jgi:predicted kinase
MHGFTGTGKSTTAQRLSAGLAPGSQVLHTAVVRRELGLAPDQANAPRYEFKLDDATFVRHVSTAVYAELLRRAERLASDGYGVVLDGTYNFRWQRQPVYDLSARLGLHVAVVHCKCTDEEEIRRRLEARVGSETSPLNEAADWETYLSTTRLTEPVVDDELPDGGTPHIIEVDTRTAVVSSRSCSECDDCRRIAHTLEGYGNLQ